MKKIRVTKTEAVLLELIEWAKGNRGTKHGNPYMVPEMKSAMQHLAKRYGFKDWMDISELIRGR